MTFQFSTIIVVIIIMVKIKTIIIVMTVLNITTAKMVIGDYLVVSTVLEPNFPE